MKWLHQLLFRLRPFVSRSQVHRDIDEELHFHIEMETEKNVQRGMSPAEARRVAVVEFGGIERFREEVRDVDGVSVLERIGSDLKYGLRVLRKNPVFTGVGVLTLALGIGASTAIFSVVDGILLRRLPFPEPDRLVTVWSDYTRRGGPVREWLSYPNFHDLRAIDGVFEDVGFHGAATQALTGEGDAQQLVGVQVSYGMLSRVLRVEPAMGRGFRPEDDVPNAPPVVLLTNALWVSQFGSDPEAVGRSITLDDQPITVIGVLPRGFRHPYQENADFFSPARWNETTHFGGRGSAVIRSMARLGPGVSLEAARGEADRLGALLEQSFPEANTGVGYAVFPLQGDLVRAASPALWTLLGAVAFVLLIVCVNLANLLLARGASRGPELAVRGALGASRGRIVGQLLVESVLLAAIGGTLGLLVAFAGTEFLVSLAPAGTPRIHEVALDGRVLAFAGLSSLLAGILFGLAPSLRSARTDLRGALSEAGREGGSSPRRGTLRSWLVAGQVALAMVLLVGAGLLLRSFRQLSQVDLGFEPSGVVTFSFPLPASRYPDAESIVGYHEDLERRIAALPGVAGVGAVNSLPLTGSDGDSDFRIEGMPPPGLGEEMVAWIRRTTPGYFEALGLRTVSGRAFTENDGRDAARVVLVNETLAQRYFGGEDPVGRRLVFGSVDDYAEIVGVAGNVRNFGVRDDARSAIYFPYAQRPSRFMSVVVQAAGDPANVIPLVRREVGAVDPSLAPNIAEMESVVRNALAVDRFVTTLLSLFAAVALSLAAVGLYGVVSYGVSRRMQEMGVRVALGAARGEISRLVVGGSLGLRAIGVVIGLLGAFALTRFMGGLLYGVSASDPTTFAGVAVLLVLVARWPPARFQRGGRRPWIRSRC